MRVDLVLSLLLAVAFVRGLAVLAHPRHTRDDDVDTEHVSPRWLAAHRDVAPAAAPAAHEPGQLTIGLQPGTAIHLVKTPKRRAS